MRIVRRIFNIIVAFVCANVVAACWQIPYGTLPVLLLVALLFVPLAGLVAILCVPQRRRTADKRLNSMANGCELLYVFICSTALTVPLQIFAAVYSFNRLYSWDNFGFGYVLYQVLLSVFAALIVESAVFWAGMLRIYTQSVQLGVKHRVLGLLFAWIPGLNIYYLMKMVHIVEAEIDAESEKQLLNAVRAESALCRTRYPLVLVHGVFFRDFRYLNYWGRIPAELKRNGAVIYYGAQQSAASVEDCGKELAVRIQKIVQETGCEKVNLIAHSKGGLDCRAAISSYGAAQYTASLTTINTPHYGCLFADYLLEKTPQKVQKTIAGAYNATLKKFGDSAPDFLCAVADLTSAACLERNAHTPDCPGVWYQSVMSYCKRAGSGKFPLNISYPLVKHFDGKNDGLVSADSAKWGEKFTLLEPPSKRGISHADMIDLNRENIPGFDVREFYVELVSDLKMRGF